MTAHATTLTLVCKRPREGVAKQRIAAQLGKAPTHELATLLLNCAVEDLASWQGPRAVLVAQASDVSWASTLCPDAGVVVQCEGNLGDRIVDGTQTIGDKGREPVLFIGSDCPELDNQYLQTCANSLQTHDVVLGDASDGGVVVMGTRSSWPILNDLPWSTDSLRSALVQRCTHAGMTIARHKALTDIDDASQLCALNAALAIDQRPARRALHDWLQHFLSLADSTAIGA